MVYTIELVKAVRDIGHYSRHMLKAEAAERIAQAFGTSLKQLGLTPEHVNEGIDWSRRLETWSDGEAVITYELARRIADLHNPGWDANLEPCPYGGAGKSADWATFIALDAIKKAIDWPDMYVREVNEPPPVHTDEDGNKYELLGEHGKTLGYELIQANRHDNGTRHVLQFFTTEDEAYAELVTRANEEQEFMSVMSELGLNIDDQYEEGGEDNDK